MFSTNEGWGCNLYYTDTDICVLQLISCVISKFCEVIKTQTASSIGHSKSTELRGREIKLVTSPLCVDTVATGSLKKTVTTTVCLSRALC